MAIRRSLLLDYVVYVLVRLIVCVVQALSWDRALSLARVLAWILFHVDRRHRLVAFDNLRHAYDHLDEAALDRLVRATYLHLATVFIEIIRMPRVLHRHNVYAYLHHADLNDAMKLRGLASIGRPGLTLAGHFGNWEILSYASGLIGMRGGIVTRRLDNPYLDQLLAGFRRKTGMILLDKTGDLTNILETLERKIGLGLVGDQDAGPRGLFVDFFGRSASTFKSIALLAMQYQAPILVMGAARVGAPMKYVIYLEDIIMPEDYAEETDAMRAITQRYTAALERMVRRHPEQYLWLHRRWKTQPAPRRARKAA